LQAIKHQEDAINNLMNNSNITNYKTVESNLLKNIHSFDRKIDQVIISMKEYDCLTVSHLWILGQSMHRILKRLLTIYNKKCSLNIIANDIYIQPNDISIPMIFLLEMTKFGNALNGQKHEAVKNTLKLSGKKIGRVAGKKYKSKFDKHKNKIMKMHLEKKSKKKICETIGIGTPQAIGKYIKAVNEQTEKQKNKQKKNTTYLPIKRVDHEKLSWHIGF